MKKFFSLALVAVMLCSSITVSAATEDKSATDTYSQNKAYDYFCGVDKTAEYVKVLGARMSQVFYQADELHYEFRNDNNEFLNGGNLGDLVTSTSDMILSRYENGSSITVPYLQHFVVYPEGTLGFDFKKDQMYFTMYEFSGKLPTSSSMEIYANGSHAMGWVDNVSQNEFGGFKYGTVDGKANYRFRLFAFNTSPTSRELNRLNVIKYVD